MRQVLVLATAFALSAGGFGLSSARADDGIRLLRLDHYVSVRSAVPAIAGQNAQIYVREVVEAATVLRGGPAQDRVAFFIHGAGTPAEVSFDVPYRDYSWMAYLAHAGFDVFSMDMAGYGRSARPVAMNDPCNLTRAQQAAYVPALIPALCDPSYSHQMTTLSSDWQDIDAVVNHVRALRHVDKLNLLGWSLGGPRSAGYAAQHAEKVLKMVLLAPAYNRNAAAEPPARFGERSRHEHAVPRRIHRELGSPGGLPCPVRAGGFGFRLVGDAALRFRRCDLGWRRAAGTAGHHVGMDDGRGFQDAGSDTDDLGSP